MMEMPALGGGRTLDEGWERSGWGTGKVWGRVTVSLLEVSRRPPVRLVFWARILLPLATGT
jgi:hypothetical protein